jgi:hypothetical protein
MILEKLNDNPWQFEPGDVVYIAGHKQQPAKVTAAFGHGRSSWPHYSVVDWDGHEWVLPQQCLSRSIIPILNRS